MLKKPVNKNSASETVQSAFIKTLQSLLPPSLGLAEELADLLNVSIDSAYRRIRGNTEFSIEELYTISKKYNISIDSVFNINSESVTFRYTKLTDDANNFENYISRIILHLQQIKSVANSRIYYAAEEIPIFYSFATKKLAEFKLFYWQRSVLNVAEYQNLKFDWGIIPQKLVDKAHESFKEYLAVPSVEIWCDETVFTGISQLKYYFESGILKKELALELLIDYRHMIETVLKNAESGRKQISDLSETFSLYRSDVLIGTNCIFVTVGNAEYSYISFNTVNSLVTSNKDFCEETRHWIKNLEKKSTHISGVGEKERFRFFDKMFRQIDKCIEEIK